MSNLRDKPSVSTGKLVRTFVQAAFISALLNIVFSCIPAFVDLHHRIMTMAIFLGSSLSIPMLDSHTMAMDYSGTGSNPQQGSSTDPQQGSSNNPQQGSSGHLITLEKNAEAEKTYQKFSKNLDDLRNSLATRISEYTDNARNLKDAYKVQGNSAEARHLLDQTNLSYNMMKEEVGAIEAAVSRRKEALSTMRKYYLQNHNDLYG